MIYLKERKKVNMTDMTLNFSLFEDKSKNESYSTEADGIGLGPL